MNPLQSMFVTDDFGPRTRPTKGATSNHMGLDLRGKVGDPVASVGPGTVVFAGKSAGYGNLIIIDHGNGLRTKYGHLNKISVQQGQKVEAGFRIGDVGNTGVSTGSHLHFGVLQNGKYVDPRRFGWWGQTKAKPKLGPPKPKLGPPQVKR